MPILTPREGNWESGVTFNAAATYLAPSPENNSLITRLAAATLYQDARLSQGVVAVHYRARPRVDPAQPLTRSYVGLALYTPSFEMLYRFPEPVVSPDLDPTSLDSLGVEDPRVIRIGDAFHMVYCGSGLAADNCWAGTLCTAKSTDLLNWEKTAPLNIVYRDIEQRGRFDDTYFDNMPGLKASRLGINNKDGVLLPDKIDGRWFLLHRPMVGRLSKWAIHLASSTDSIIGEWRDHGPIVRANGDIKWLESWVGAGAVPIPLGDNRYLAITHTGNLAADGSRMYSLDAIVLNFNRFDPNHPEAVVESRLDELMLPTTPWEIDGPYPDSVGNVLFSCGAFEREGEIFVVYGGGDTYLMAARINLAELLSAMEPQTV